VSGFSLPADFGATAPRDPAERRIAVVSAGLSQPSSTRLLADRLAGAAREGLEAEGLTVEIETFELREFAHDVVDNLLTGFASDRLDAMIQRVVSADGLVIVTPTFSTSYSGLMKSFVDVLDPTSLAGMPVLIGATGGTERHSLVLDYAMRPLFTYLKAVVAPTGVYAASSDWGSGGDAGAGALPDRILRAGRELAALVSREQRAQPVDPFASAAGLGGFQPE
jgi:FMN reductase